MCSAIFTFLVSFQRIGAQQRFSFVCLLFFNFIFLCTFSNRVLATDLELNTYARLASDYVYRGISYSGGRLSPELGVNANHSNGFNASFWLGEDDIAGVLGETHERDIEMEFQLGYQKIVSDRWVWGVTWVWHEFRQENQPRNHDYQETRLQLAYRDNWIGFLAHAHDIWASGLNASTLGVSKRSVFNKKYFLEHEIGLVDFDRGESDRDGTTLYFFRFSVARAIGKNIQASIDYHYSESTNGNFFNPDRIGNRFVFGINYQFGKKF